jgi:hypothetical protein
MFLLLAADSLDSFLVAPCTGGGGDDAAIDSLLSFNFLSPCSDILFSSATKDWPQKALCLSIPVSEVDQSQG